MPPLTPEEIEYILSQQPGAYAANTYGSGPGYLTAEENPYARLGQREGAITDIFKTAGIYPEDLLGLPEAPEQPDAPDFYQSDVAPLYASNPLMQAAQELLGEGMDPISVTRAIQTKVAETPELEQYVPRGFSAGPGGAQQEYADWGSFGETLNRIATDNQRSSREQGQYQSQVDAYNQYFQPQSEFDLMGSPDLETYVQQQYGGYKPSTMARTNVVRGNYFGPGEGAPVNAEGRTESEQNMWNRRYLQSSGQAPDATEAEILAGMAPEVDPNTRLKGRASVTHGVGPGRETSPLRLTVNDTSTALMEAYGRKRLQEAQGNMLPSQAEQDNRARLANAYQLLYGEQAPTQDVERQFIANVNRGQTPQAYASRYGAKANPPKAQPKPKPKRPNNSRRK